MQVSDLTKASKELGLAALVAVAVYLLFSRLSSVQARKAVEGTQAPIPGLDLQSFPGITLPQLTFPAPVYPNPFNYSPADIIINQVVMQPRELPDLPEIKLPDITIKSGCGCNPVLLGGVQRMLDIYTASTGMIANSYAEVIETINRNAASVDYVANTLLMHDLGAR